MNRSNVVDQAITSRRSIRRFLDRPVSKSELREILQVSARAPSGSNSQPWKVYALAGRAKEKLSEVLVSAHYECRDAHTDEYQYEPHAKFETYLARRKDFGTRLYGRLQIEYSDNPERTRQIARNYLFFDAPIGLIFTLRKELGLGSWLDGGMFLQNIMTSARGRGLDTCAQVSFAKYHRIIKPMLSIPDTELIVCGMAIGYADTAAPENHGWMPRDSVDQFAQFVGFEGSACSEPSDEEKRVYSD